MDTGTSQAILVYNTLSRSLEPLTPLEAGKIGMYVCGPTVYDDPHIGHLRSAFVFDVILRALKRRFEVRFVRNVTDVDDKIIDRAARDKSDWKEVSVKYLAAYHAALSKMAIAAPDAEPKATCHIAEMIDLTKKLIAEGKAYESAGSVYFKVRALDSYGRLSNQKIDEILENNRVEAEEGKADALDFALWKATKPGEPSWPSPWGEGRPGWHIECSAMTLKSLGEEFDIHGGGRDLLFPHHENERAQSVAATGKGFAKVWIHHGLLTIEGRKMSKSLGNFVTLEEIEKRGHTVDALKLLFLQSHYRSDVDFTWQKMTACEAALGRIRDFLEKVELMEPQKSNISGKAGKDAELDSFLYNDFDTPGALSLIFDQLKAGNIMLTNNKGQNAAALAEWILKACHQLGLFKSKSLSAAEVEWRHDLRDLLLCRERMRKERKFKASDYIRQELSKLGLDIEDGRAETLVLPHVSVSGADMKAMIKSLKERALELS